MRAPSTIAFLLALALGSSAALAAEATLTPAEKSAGWRLLFDGKTRKGWTGMKGTPFPAKSWVVEDGMIRTTEDGSDGDLVTTKPYDNFELVFEYRLAKGGNSGVKYGVQQEWLSPHWTPEAPARFKADQAIAAVGYEFQIYDDDTLERKPGWDLSSTGALYLLEAPHDKKMNPPGEWNTARVVVNGKHVEHWLNGSKLLEYELGSDELLAKVEKTKFRKVPGYGQKAPGYIVLQHHGSPAWFRNIKIREIH
ncbi:MAG: DUF1080 domain-containing protein [Bryobacterales bacterium]|nr:DUF1080 domain-containing protein [Acidobacteriota bacterium]MCB9384696.1 DUF1080 domain-containing protein [Bryobacterales bacterium]